MQLDYLREFILLSRCPSFNVAAKQLHVSQSALSKHISALEREFNAKLIRRDSQLSLTRPGGILLTHAQLIINTIDQAKQEINDELKATRTSLKVRLPNASKLSFRELLSCVDAFKLAYPHIDVAIMPPSNDNPLQAIHSGELDGGLYCMLAERPRDSEGDGLLFAPLCDEAIVAWVGTGDPLSRKEALTPTDLSNRRFPIPSKSQTMNAEMFTSRLIEHFDIDASIVLTEESSIEDFLIQRLTDEDIVVLMESMTYDSAMEVRQNRTLKSFSPKVLLTTWYAFGLPAHAAPDDPHCHAVNLLRDFMESYYLQKYRPFADPHDLETPHPPQAKTRPFDS